MRRQGKPPVESPIVAGVARVEQLRDTVAAVCEAAKIRRVTFHALRHTFASLALESGMDIVTVSRILGHRSVDFTARMYVHVSRDRMADGADRMDAYLRPANGPATATAKEA